MDHFSVCTLLDEFLDSQVYYGTSTLNPNEYLLWGCIKRIKKVFSQRRQENAKIVISCSLACYTFLLCGHFAASREKFTFETAPFLVFTTDY